MLNSRLRDGINSAVVPLELTMPVTPLLIENVSAVIVVGSIILENPALIEPVVATLFSPLSGIVQTTSGFVDTLISSLQEIQPSNNPILHRNRTGRFIYRIIYSLAVFAKL